MTLRICPEAHDDHQTLHLEGRLGADEVPELERSAVSGVCALDLRYLLSADEDGVAALRRLRERGIELRNPSHSLALRLG